MSKVIEDFRSGKIVIAINSQEEMQEAIDTLAKNSVPDFIGFGYCEGCYYGLYFDESGYNQYYNQYPAESLTYTISAFKKLLSSPTSGGMNPRMESQYFDMVDILIKVAKEK